MKLLKFLKSRKAFTIVELVIVIAVIAVLAAVLIPTFSGVIDKANDSATLQNGRNMYMEYISTDDNYSKANDNFIIEVEENEKYVVFKDGKIVEEVYSSKNEASSSLGNGVKCILLDENLNSSEYTTPGEPETPNDPDEPEKPEVIDLGTYTFEQQTTAVSDYLESDIAKYENGYDQSYFDSVDGGTSKIPNGYTFEKLDSKYTNIVIKDSLGNIYYEDTITDGTYTVYNLIPNEEYTCEFTDGTYVLATAKLTATGQVRQIYTTNVPIIDGNTQRAQNIRDLGGWKVTNDNIVKYGLIYRSAMLDHLNDKDIDILKNILNIGCVIDLRGPLKEGTTGNHLNLDSDYYIVPTASVTQYSEHLQSLKTYEKDIYKKIFECIEDDIPVIFHCSAGADRTGTYAFMLEALLGVNESNLANDYELTMLSYYNTQTKVTYNPNNDSTKGYVAMVEYFKTLPGNTFEEKAFNWFLSIGFDSATLNNFRNKMINDNPKEYVRVEYESLNSTSENEGIVEKGQDYSFEIECFENYEIESITITKKGEKIEYLREENKITIKNLTDDIVISVICKQVGSSYSNLCVSTESGYISGNIDSPKTNKSSSYYTNIIENVPNEIGTIIRIKGIVDNGSSYNRVAIANEKGEVKIKAENNNLFGAIGDFCKYYKKSYDEQTGVYIFEQIQLHSDAETLKIQFCFDGLTEETSKNIIITINEEIK